MSDELTHIATAAALLDDPYAALSQNLHGDGDAPNRVCATYECEERPVARYERGGVGSYYCADCAAALDFPGVTGPIMETRA